MRKVLKNLRSGHNKRKKISAYIKVSDTGALSVDAISIMGSREGRRSFKHAEAYRRKLADERTKREVTASEVELRLVD